MATKALDTDKSFKPLKLIDPLEMRLNLELQGLQPLQHNRQVRTIYGAGCAHGAALILPFQYTFASCSYSLMSCVQWVVI